MTGFASGFALQTLRRMVVLPAFALPMMRTRNWGHSRRIAAASKAPCLNGGVSLDDWASLFATDMAGEEKCTVSRHDHFLFGRNWHNWLAFTFFQLSTQTLAWFKVLEGISSTPYHHIPDLFLWGERLRLCAYSNVLVRWCLASKLTSHTVCRSPDGNVAWEDSRETIP